MRTVPQGYAQFPWDAEAGIEIRIVNKSVLPNVATRHPPRDVASGTFDYLGFPVLVATQVTVETR